jgi:peptidoglycan hydrolase CwlO-like protein
MTDFRSQLQADVEGIRRLRKVSSRTVKPDKEVKHVSFSVGELREESLFKARQEIALAEKQKSDLEAEYQDLKEQITKLGQGITQTDAEIVALGEVAKKTVLDMRTGSGFCQRLNATTYTTILSDQS